MNHGQHQIAPCGMNCKLCIAYVRKRKPCSGCNGPDENKPYHCAVCRIKNCEEHKTRSTNFCYDCRLFPCSRLKQLDKRYRTRYGMSMIENLNYIKQFGLKPFITAENTKWSCESCGRLLSVHRDSCPACGGANQYFPGGTDN